VLAVLCVKYPDRRAGQAGRAARKGKPMSDDDELLTVEQVAEVLKVGRTKVYELMDRGDLPSLKIDRCRRVLRSDLNTLIASLRSEAAHA
jgi:excisionase family DNA binding protein